MSQESKKNTPESSSARPSFSAAVAAGLLFAFALYQGLSTNNARDFFIYRLGAQLAARGENPYDVDTVRRHVAVAYPREDANTRDFVANCGYFLPPQAVLLFLPLSSTPATAARVCWAAALGLAAFAIALLPTALRRPASPTLSLLARTLVPFVLVLNPLTLSIVIVGQVTILTTGCVAAGLYCLDRKRPYFTAILWTAPFIKPHLAVPLVPLLWFLAGWRPALLMVLLVAVMNLIGATVVGGSPRFLVDYLDAVSEAHKTVGFNRVESNPGIASWNCLLHLAGGPLVELSAGTTLAGYVVWFGLVFGRMALLRPVPPVQVGEKPETASGLIATTTPPPPSAAWMVAAAAVGAALCSQVLRYELLVLALLTPWLRELFAGGHRLWGWLAVALLGLLLLPPAATEKLGFVVAPSLDVALLAALVLAGPLVYTPRQCGKMPQMCSA